MLIIKVFFYTAIAILFNYISSQLGTSRYSINSGYTSTTDLYKRTTTFMYSYMLLIGPVMLLFSSFIIKLFNVNFLFDELYLIPIIYFIFRIVLLSLVLDRWILVNKVEFFSAHLISISLSILYFQTLINNNLFASIVPFDKDISLAIFLAVFAYVSGTVHSKISERYNYHENVEKYILHNYSFLTKKYKEDLKDLQKKDLSIIMSIMIFENYQRASTIRFFERILHKIKLAESTGIMQIKDKSKIYSDSESINFIKQKISKLNEEKRDLKFMVFNIYGQTNSYYESVESIYKIITKVS